MARTAVNQAGDDDSLHLFREKRFDCTIPNCSRCCDCGPNVCCCDDTTTAPATTTPRTTTTTIRTTSRTTTIRTTPRTTTANRCARCLGGNANAYRTTRNRCPSGGTTCNPRFSGPRYGYIFCPVVGTGPYGTIGGGTCSDGIIGVVTCAGAGGAAPTCGVSSGTCFCSYTGGIIGNDCVIYTGRTCSLSFDTVCGCFRCS